MIVGHKIEDDFRRHCRGSILSSSRRPGWMKSEIPTDCEGKKERPRSGFKDFT